MMDSNSPRATGEIGVAGLLLVAFILCKIIGIAPIASWSWWWVLSPGWIPLAICAAVVLVILLVALVVSAVRR